MAGCHELSYSAYSQCRGWNVHSVSDHLATVFITLSHAPNCAEYTGQYRNTQLIQNNGKQSSEVSKILL